MQATRRLKSPETGHIAPAIASTMPDTTPPGSEAAATGWKPQPSGLSRSELRRIVRKILG
jgi:hypothetical protein